MTNAMSDSVRTCPGVLTRRKSQEILRFCSPPTLLRRTIGARSMMRSGTRFETFWHAATGPGERTVQFGQFGLAAGKSRTVPSHGGHHPAARRHDHGREDARRPTLPEHPSRGDGLETA